MGIRSVEGRLTALHDGSTFEGMRLDTRALAELCERHDIERLRVFGSFARGDASADSDVDFVAYFRRRKSLLELVRIEREFSERLGRKVDLLTEPALSPYLRERILAESSVVYERAA